MRPTAWVSLLAAFLLAAAVCNGLSLAQAKSAPRPRADHLPSWVVPGDWMTTEEEAVQDALDKSRAKLIEYLRAQTPPMEWPVDPTYLRLKLWQDLKADNRSFEALGWKEAREVAVPLDVKTAREGTVRHLVQVEGRQFDERVGKMYRAAVLVEVSESVENDFRQQEQQYQTKQRQERSLSRQGVLVRVLAGLVALLAVVACYLRLEDATKGYYTTLLRLAVVVFVALVGAGIWFLGRWLL